MCFFMEDDIGYKNQQRNVLVKSNKLPEKHDSKTTPVANISYRSIFKMSVKLWSSTTMTLYWILLILWFIPIPEYSNNIYIIYLYGDHMGSIMTMILRGLTFFTEWNSCWRSTKKKIFNKVSEEYCCLPFKFNENLSHSGSDLGGEG